MQSSSEMMVPRKHPCADCRMCQGCSESRCRACRTGRNGVEACKLSIHEQIALFDSLNPGLVSTNGSCRCSAADGDKEK